MSLIVTFMVIFFFNDTATTEIYTLSLHDALPIYERPQASFGLRAALPIDSDLPTAGVAAVHPLLCLENTAARVFIARPARLLGFLVRWSVWASAARTRFDDAEDRS